MLHQRLNLGRAVQIDMRHEPERRRPVGARGHRLHEIGAARRDRIGDETEPHARPHRRQHRGRIRGAKYDGLGRHRRGKPALMRRALDIALEANEAVPAEIGIIL